MNIYVGNLSRQAVEREVMELFSSFGEVKSVRIIKDRETSESRGFGFVEMPEQESAQQAINELNGAEFQKRRLIVNEAKPKTPQSFNSFSSPFGYKNRFAKY